MRERARQIQDSIARTRGGGGRAIADLADIAVEYGKGSYLFSTDGTKYLDVVTGYGVASLGHAHSDWVTAVVKQARQLAVSPLPTRALAEYTDALAQVLPPKLSRLELFSTGGEAVEAAIKLCQTDDRPDVLTFKHSFHGKSSAVRYVRDPDTTEAEQLAPTWMRSADFPVCRDHDPLTYEACEESAEEALREIEQQDDLGDVCAVLVEPVLGTAGNLPPVRPFLPALRALCDRRGWALIFDESITGFGRTGELFAFRNFAVEPDVLVLSKGLAGGFPLSAVCSSGELWERSTLSAPSGTSSSYGGNPLACAAGLATLKIIDDTDFLWKVNEVANHAAGRLVELAKASREVSWPRGLGLMLGFDLVDPNTSQPASQQRCEEVFRACCDRRVLISAHVPRVRLAPPLTLSIQEADQLFDVLHSALG